MTSVLQAFFDNYGQTNGTLVNLTNGVADQIYRFDGIHKIVDDSQGPYFPVWETSPVLKEIINFNFRSDKIYGRGSQDAVDKKMVVIGRMTDISIGSNPFSGLSKSGESLTSSIFVPTFNAIQDPREVVGLTVGHFRWTDYLQAENLPPEADGIVCVLANECNQIYSFGVLSGKVVYLGQGDLHDESFDYLEHMSDLKTLIAQTDSLLVTPSGVPIDSEYCAYSLHVYPSGTVQAKYVTNKPLVNTAVVLIVCAVTFAIFIYYDWHVESRQRVLLGRAVRSHQIISSLFPALVRDRLFGDDDEREKKEEQKVTSPSAPIQPLESLENDKVRLKKFLHTGGHKEAEGSKPIADLFPDCTVLFADIAGFTAWSSVREPAQVFILLENLYSGRHDHHSWH